MEISVLNYIYDQPRALRETFIRRAEFLDPFVDFLKKHSIHKIHFLGSGTSYNASQILFQTYCRHGCGWKLSDCI